MGSKSKLAANSGISWGKVHLSLVVIACGLFLLYQYKFASPSSSSLPSSSSSGVAAVPVLQTSPKTGLKFHSVPYDANDVANLRWGIIFDAGSTGSRVHIYRFRLGGASPLLEDEIFLEVKPGLSAYVPKGVGADAGSRDVGQTSKPHERKTGPDAAAASLTSLLDLCVEQIPKSAHWNTPISLRATAGLRLLGEDISSSILKSIRSLFDRYPFPFKPTDVEVMGGSEEGVFAWITVNYLNGQLVDTREPGLKPGPQMHGHPPTSAILDLGGASTQIVFEPDFDSFEALGSELQNQLYQLPYGQNTYYLYETSYLGYGLMEARRRVKGNLLDHPALEVHPLRRTTDPTSGAEVKGIEIRSHTPEGVPIKYHPCLSDAHEEIIEDADGKKTLVRGYPQGHASCAALIRPLFPKSPNEAPCLTAPFCSFGGRFGVPLQDFDYHIYAFSYFYDRTIEIFELEEEANSGPDGSILRLSRIRQLADTICSTSIRALTRSDVTGDVTGAGEVRSAASIEEEKSEDLAARIAAKKTKGCKKIQVKALDGTVSEILISGSDSSSGAETVQVEDEGECMLEEKPEVGKNTQKISSPFMAMLVENPYLCLDLSYAHTLLHHGYDLPEKSDLHIMKRIQKKEVGWCLGAILSQMAERGW